MCTAQVKFVKNIKNGFSDIFLLRQIILCKKVVVIIGKDMLGVIKNKSILIGVKNSEKCFLVNI